MLLVVYDITNQKRLKKISNFLEKYGLRAQNSTFEIDKKNKKEIVENLKKLVKKEEGDKIFIFEISNKEEYKKELAKIRRLWDFIT